MKKYEVSKIRNVAFIGQGGCGKTSLAETLLFATGVTTRLGRVDDGTSVLDFEPEEKAHKFTISSALAFAEHKKHKINLIDTPGYDVFLFDAQTSLQASDAAVLVVSAEPGGLKFESEKLWGYCEEFALPRAVVITKMDKENSNFDTALQDLQAAFPDARFVPLHLPIGAEESFAGYVDLITQQGVTFSGEDGKGSTGAVPEELAGAVASSREAMIESLVETDDALMEKYFDGQDISDAELLTALAAGLSARQFVPVLVASAAKNIGAGALLDLITDAFPSPLDRGPVVALDAEGNETTVLPEEDAPLAALVFKTISDPFAGKLNLIRVFSGALCTDSSVWNATKESEERIGQVVGLVGKETKPLEVAVPGDIVSVPKLKVTSCGDTFSVKGRPVSLPVCEPPEPLVEYATYAKTKGEEEKMGQGLKRMREEDPTLRTGREPQTHELLVSGMGKLHLNIVLERMKRKYGADVDLRLPKIPYRETIKGSTKVQGRHKKQTGGRGQFADTWIEIKPLPRGEGYRFVDNIVGGAIPRQFIPAVDAGVKERMARGVIAGYPVVDVEVSLFDGKYHDVDSSEMAFKIAGSVGFKKGVAECRPTLLEPIYEINVTVPDEHLGDVIGDLNSRRGRVLGMDPQRGKQLIRAHVPLSEVQEYAPDLRSMTSGRGTYTMQYDHYDEVPAQLAEKIIAAAQVDEDED
jgi:elongation factor G